MPHEPWRELCENRICNHAARGRLMPIAIGGAVLGVLAWVPSPSLAGGPRYDSGTVVFSGLLWW